MIQLELQMDMLWVLFGSTIKVRPMSISEQNATSRNQVTGLAATLLHLHLCCILKNILLMLSRIQSYSL